MNMRLTQLLGLLVLASSTNQIVRADVTLGALCDDRPISLESISKTRELIEENEKNPLQTCDKYRESLTELDKILSLVQSGHICNLEFVNEIRDYHMKFIYMDEGGDSKQAGHIPDPLKLFFITLCFQISAQCKMTLINNLEYDTKDLINREDYEQIELLETHGATLLNDKTEIADFDDILLLEDMNMANGDLSGVQETSMSVLVQTTDVLRQLTSVCKRKFRPFYERHIMPLIKLSHLGYNYQGELLEREIEELKKNRFIKRWYNIVQICESLSMIRIYQNTEKTDESSGVINFVGKEQEADLRARNLRPIDEEETSGDIVKVPEQVEHMDDVLWIKGQQELRKLIKKHQATASEADRIRDKMIRQVLDKFKALLTSGKVLLLANELIACKRQDLCQVDKQSMNLDMLELIDEVVEVDAIEKGTLEASSERAVAWFGGNKEDEMSSRSGMRTRRTRDYPRKPPARKKVKDYTSWWAKFKKGLKRFRASKLTVVSWLMGIFGFLLVLIGLVARG